MSQDMSKPRSEAHAGPRVLYVLSVLVLTAMVLSACGDSGSAAQAPSTPGDLEDGVYTAAYSHVDNHWWQPFLHVRVRNGNVVAAQFDYVNTVGDLKSNDGDYGQRMEFQTGTYPAEYTSLLENRLITTQQSQVDGVAGATGSTRYFHHLARAVMSAAERGDDEIITLPMNETYTAVDEPDEREWVASIGLEYVDGDLVEVNYDEVVLQDGQVIASKSENDEYAARYAAVYDLTPAEVHIQLELALRETEAPSEIDTITGATDTSNRFRRVAGWALEKRVSADLPPADFGE